MVTIISRSKLYLGTEILWCPQCKGVVSIPVHSDMPERIYLSCRGCGYRAVLNTVPILDKYGLPHGLSQSERRQTATCLKNEVAKI